MPATAGSTAGATCGLILERLALIVRTQGMASELGATYASIAIKEPGGVVATVQISEFFDHAMADTIAAIDDVALAAAVRALREAEKEFIQDLKNRHRHTAEMLLRLAFEGNESKIRDRAAKTFKIVGKKDVALHYQALEVAATIATLARQPGGQETMDSWVESTKLHLAKAGVFLITERDVHVERYNRRYGKGVNAAKVLGAFDPYPGDSERSARQDAERAMAAADEYQLNMQRWAVWARALRGLA